VSPTERKQLQSRFCIQGVFALDAYFKDLVPHPYVAHCISGIVVFVMDSHHTCARCWRVKPMSIGM
jgi:hypothetical protein